MLVCRGLGHRQGSASVLGRSWESRQQSTDGCSVKMLQSLWVLLEMLFHNSFCRQLSSGHQMPCLILSATCSAGLLGEGAKAGPGSLGTTRGFPQPVPATCLGTALPGRAACAALHIEVQSLQCQNARVWGTLMSKHIHEHSNGKNTCESVFGVPVPAERKEGLTK